MQIYIELIRIHFYLRVEDDARFIWPLIFNVFNCVTVGSLLNSTNCSSQVKCNRKNKRPQDSHCIFIVVKTTFREKKSCIFCHTSRRKLLLINIELDKERMEINENQPLVRLLQQYVLTVEVGGDPTSLKSAVLLDAPCCMLGFSPNVLSFFLSWTMFFLHRCHRHFVCLCAVRRTKANSLVSMLLTSAPAAWASGQCGSVTGPAHNFTHLCLFTNYCMLCFRYMVFFQTLHVIYFIVY